ncbi:FtsP/CotA-like multicopper oxidase with cupredoxin domain [Bradyrhizobium diazoefficiens]
MFTRRAALISAAATALMLATPALAADDLKLPRQKVELVAPPFVHAHEQATKQGPKIVEFKLTIEEKKVVIDEKGTTFQAMTFNGSMPGPLMVVHEGDYVETTLVNPATNTMPHNIDFHSATGALGGGALTLINPGEQVVLRWKATKTGVFVYHCAPGGPMIPWPRRLRHERCRDGAAARRTERRQGPRAEIRQGLLCRRAGHVRAARREGQFQVL